MDEVEWTSSQQEVLREAERLVQAATSPDQALGPVAELLAARMRHFSWVGFYLLEGGQLRLGPNSGRNHPPHQPALELDRGPQGLAAAHGETVLLPDLRHSPRWLCCPAAVLSEIVVPIHQDGTVYAEIDVDSRKPDGFSLQDRRFLEALAERLSRLLWKCDTT